MNKKEASKLTIEEADNILNIFNLQCTPEEAQAFLRGNVINERVQDAMWAQLRIDDIKYEKRLLAAWKNAKSLS